MYGYCTRMIIITARRSYATAVLGVVILSVCPSVRLSVRLSHACFVTNPKKTYWRYFYTTRKGNPSSFLLSNSGWWATSPFTLMGDRSDPPPSKIAHVDGFSPNKRNFEVEQTSLGISAIAELLVQTVARKSRNSHFQHYSSYHTVQQTTFSQPPIFSGGTT